MGHSSGFAFYSVVALLAGCATAPAPRPSGPSAEVAPAAYTIDLDTSVGPIVVTVNRADAPIGADRLYQLVQAHYLDGARFFRVVPGFVVQFGLAADPAVSKTWDKEIADDPVKGTNARGTVVFAATDQPNSRTTQLFFNLADNGRLDGMGFAPVGRVVSGMENVDKIYSDYGESPDQGQIEDQGNAYLAASFPQLDFIKTARIRHP